MRRKPITRALRRIYSSTYRKKHRKEIRKRQKEYWLNHREYYRGLGRKYSHTDKGRKAKREYCQRRSVELEFRLRKNLRTRVWLALRRGKKLCGTEALLGCTVEFLRGWLEKRFVRGMSWKNYGRWEIDHIKPCVGFDLTKVSEQRRCFHYTNLQPLWKFDNRSKGGGQCAFL